MKTATVVLITRENLVLLGRKQGDPEIGVGTLNGPGGKMESTDKNTLDCVIRETQEEFEIVFDPTKLKKVVIITFHVGDEPWQEVHFYRTSAFSGEPQETESMVPEWPRSAQPFFY
ncbi:NUDIX domain-containing protein [Candidatus Kaiserbacteria bacterium]|nr:NUDIX domain-containing protein [Candidatus Kaiserbacteria bacterium]